MNNISTITKSKEQKSVDIVPEKTEAGRNIYNQQGCARCHSIGGKGNPRNPLDNIGNNRGQTTFYRKSKKGDGGIKF